ncbi:MAG: hypothetical protein ACK5D8_11265 [Bacteroidota bacterium]
MTILLIPFFVSAQLVNIESQRVSTDTIRFTMNTEASATFRYTDGENFSSYLFNITSQWKNRSLKNIFMFVGGIDFSRLDRKEISNSQLIHLRFNRKFNSLLRLEVFTQYQKSPHIGISER